MSASGAVYSRLTSASCKLDAVAVPHLNWCTIPEAPWQQPEQRQRPQRHHIGVPDEEVAPQHRIGRRRTQLHELRCSMRLMQWCLLGTIGRRHLCEDQFWQELTCTTWMGLLAALAYRPRTANIVTAPLACQDFHAMAKQWWAAHTRNPSRLLQIPAGKVAAAEAAGAGRPVVRLQPGAHTRRQHTRREASLLRIRPCVSPYIPHPVSM